MTAVVQIVGAMLLLAGFVAAQLGALRDTSVPYLAVNVAGAASLAVVALLDHEWGFLLLEGSWAGISTAGVLRAVRRAHPPAGDPVTAPAPTNRVEPTTPQRPPPAPGEPNRRAAPGRRARPPLPPTRAAQLAGDELSEPSRLIHLIRDSYAGAQGRQWLQPHILWWILTFLRDHGTVPDWTTLTSPTLARTITSLGLPPGHTTVEPTNQVAMNFGLWWSLLADLTQLAYRPWWSCRWPRRRLPDAAQLDQRTAHLGLRPWMSSATFEEISGIARALAHIQDHHRRHPPDPDDFMVRILLPALLIAELHWLYIPGGRPRPENRAPVDVVLLRRYDKAVTKWTAGHSLTALDHMYLRAGDILHHLSSHPRESVDPVLRPMIDLYTQLRLDHDRTATPPQADPPRVQTPLGTDMGY